MFGTPEQARVLDERRPISASASRTRLPGSPSKGTRASRTSSFGAVARSYVIRPDAAATITAPAAINSHRRVRDGSKARITSPALWNLREGSGSRHRLKMPSHRGCTGASFRFSRSCQKSGSVRRATVAVTVGEESVTGFS